MIAVTVIAFDIELDLVCSQHFHKITQRRWKSEVVIPEDQVGFDEDSSVDLGVLRALAGTEGARYGSTVAMITGDGDRGVQGIPYPKRYWTPYSLRGYFHSTDP